MYIDKKYINRVSSLLDNFNKSFNPKLNPNSNFENETDVI